MHDYWKKTIAFTRWTFVGLVMSLLFNMLSIGDMNIKSNQQTHTFFPQHRKVRFASCVTSIITGISVYDNEEYIGPRVRKIGFSL